MQFPLEKYLFTVNNRDTKMKSIYAVLSFLLMVLNKYVSLGSMLKYRKVKVSFLVKVKKFISHFNLFNSKFQSYTP